MRQGSPPYDLRSLLGGSLKALDLQKRVREETCLLYWDEVVGEQVAGAAQPDFVRDGKVFVTVKNSVWANELTFLKADIVSRLNDRIGSRVIKDLIFKAGRMRARPSPAGEKASEAPDLAGIELTEAELASVDDAVKAAGDPVGEPFRRLLTTAIRLDKWKASQGWKPCRRCGALQNSETGICPTCELE